MYFHSIRRLTADNLHNMCTGAKWFQGNLYVAYRQGDAHVCPHGKLIVQRRRDQGDNFEIVAVDRGVLHLGYDGPIRVWMNDRQIFEGKGANPAVADTTSLPVETRHGSNHLCIALDTNVGKAWGIMPRFEAA
jgi:hypothetical protein